MFKRSRLSFTSGLCRKAQSKWEIITDSRLPTKINDMNDICAADLMPLSASKDMAASSEEHLYRADGDKRAAAGPLLRFQGKHTA